MTYEMIFALAIIKDKNNRNDFKICPNPSKRSKPF